LRSFFSLSFLFLLVFHTSFLLIPFVFVFHFFFLTNVFAFCFLCSRIEYHFVSAIDPFGDLILYD
jgi:hypothetical protein